MKRKKMALLLSAALSLGLILGGCGSAQNTSAEGSGVSGKDVVKLGIIQLVEHPALDAARQGFLKVLADNGYVDGKNLKVDFKNGQNDQSTLKTISKKFVSDKEDLILAIATPAAQAIAGETSDIPILITAVTDPVAAKLVNSNEKPGTNVSGTTDMTPIEQQFEFLQKILPNAKKVGVLYNSSEVNSQVQVGIAKQVASKLGIEIVEGTVTSSADVMQVAQSMIGKVDAFYVPTDNTIASSIASVVTVAESNKIPLFASESGMVQGGALGTIGIDYEKLGEQTGQMALKVLKGEKISEMPIESQSFDDISIVINKGAAERMGVTIPKDILDQAQTVN